MTELAEFIIALIFFTGSLCIFYGPWQTQCVDQARERLFELRDKVFDLALNGELDFNSTEYKDIRRSIERNIRFAHELTIFRFLLISSYIQMQSQSEQNTLQLTLENIQNEATRQKVSEITDQCTIELIDLMFNRSLFFLIIAVIARIFGAVDKLRNILPKNTSDLIQIEADRTQKSDTLIAA